MLSGERGELVLLLAEPGQPAARTFYSVRRGRIREEPRGSETPVRQAIVRADPSAWSDLLRTHRLDPQQIDLFGDGAILEAFLSVHQSNHRPLNLRCSVLGERAKAKRSLTHVQRDPS